MLRTQSIFLFNLFFEDKEKMPQELKKVRANSPFGCADPYPNQTDFRHRFGRFPLEFCLLPFRAALRCE